MRIPPKVGAISPEILEISEFYSINTAVLTIPFLSLSVLGYIPVLGKSKKDLEKKG